MIQNRYRCQGKRTTKFRAKKGREEQGKTQGAQIKRQKSRQKNTHSNHILKGLPVSLIAGNRFAIAKFIVKMKWPLQLCKRPYAKMIYTKKKSNKLVLLSCPFKKLKNTET